MALFVKADDFGVRLALRDGPLSGPVGRGLVHVMPTLLSSDTPLGSWLRGLVGRVHKNVATVALASKLARIAWAVLRRGEPFAARQPVPVPVPSPVAAAAC